MAKKSLRFHATVKMVSDYQLVTKIPVAATRRYRQSRRCWYKSFIGIVIEYFTIEFMKILNYEFRGNVLKRLYLV